MAMTRTIHPALAVRGILLPPNTPNLLDPQGNLIWSYKG
jgi:hypothetical protein